jgi:hypothetical protein
LFKLDDGILYFGLALVFFYLYWAWLRGRKRRLARENALAMSKAHGAKKRELAAKLPDPNTPSAEVRSWPLLVVMMVLTLSAFFIRDGILFPVYQEYWWVAADIGIIGLAFCLK